MITSYEKGLIFEKKSINYFQRYGYKIIEQRVKTPYGEIDLIVGQNETLVAVEVKGRKNKKDLSYSLSVRQQRRIRDAFSQFISEHVDLLKNYSFHRFDVVLISSQGDLTHIPNAWQISDF